MTPAVSRTIAERIKTESRARLAIEQTPYLHQARSILTAAKPPEEFRLQVDPLTGDSVETPDLTQKQREDLGRFNKQFPNAPQLHVKSTGRISRKPRGKR